MKITLALSAAALLAALPALADISGPPATALDKASPKIGSAVSLDKSSTKLSPRPGGLDKSSPKIATGGPGTTTTPQR
ncbi:hypothetical protein [Oceaniglobus trochenteri]|uniref:hypothetical protein n=1 Tax=Oceaniglobus trochenteri TaxID=2763260 RepID=UPI001CFFB83E|nr:hypothetical protein [Oceaniglobus trochenteri]